MIQRIAVAFLLWSACSLFGQQAQSEVDYRIRPEQLGLPKGTLRNSEPFVTRVYRTDDSQNILTKQPEGYPKTINEDYELKDDEQCRTHQGVDFFFAPDKNSKTTPVDFNAGVYGIVRKAGDGDWGTITVETQDGTMIQYLHTLASYVKIGDIVSPETKMGVTGRTGTGRIHLHIQARFDDKPISPDLAFQLGQQKLKTDKPRDTPEVCKSEFDPDVPSSVSPTINGRTVSPAKKPDTKFIVAIVGKEDLILGTFHDYWSASKCAIAWQDAHPESLRLWKIKEVNTKVDGTR